MTTNGSDSRGFPPVVLRPLWTAFRRVEPSAVRWSSVLQSILFAAAAAGAVVPLWLVPYPPLQDLPQHLAAVRILHSYEDPAYGFAPYFTLHLWNTQYLAYYVACDLLAYVLPVRLANLVLLSTVLFATPYAAAQLLSALKRDRAYALLLLPLTYNAHLILGFFNFLAAVPLMLYGLALGVRQCTGFRRGRAVLLGGLLLLCFYTHVVPFALLFLGLCLLAGFPDRRGTVRRLASLAPAVPAMVHWLLTSPAGRSTAGAAGLASGQRSADFRSLSQAFEQLPMWLTDVFAGADDLWVLKLWTALLVALGSMGYSFRVRGPDDPQLRALRWRLAPLPVVAGLAYGLAPSGFDWIWPIAERFALLAAALLLPLLPRLRPVVRGSAMAVMLVLAVAHVRIAAAAFTGFGEEVGNVQGAIDAIPPRARVAGLVFNRGSRYVRFAPFIHYAALYQAQKGGVAMFTFADFPQSPFGFRPDSRPPRVRPRWEWLPHRVNPARDLRFYDYVLVRGGPGRIARQPSAFKQIFRSPHWRVYERLR